jgi:hypothetical protein
MFLLAGSKVRSSRRIQPVGNRRTRSRFVVAGLTVLLLGASVASAAATLQYGGPVGPGPVQFAVTGSHIQLTLMQTTIGRCNWMVYANNQVAGSIKHRAFRLSKTFSNKSMLKITGKVLSPSKLKGSIRGVVPGQCDATVSFTATRF